jgi:hypothetical protein
MRFICTPSDRGIAAAAQHQPGCKELRSKKPAWREIALDDTAGEVARLGASRPGSAASRWRWRAARPEAPLAGTRPGVPARRLWGSAGDQHGFGWSLALKTVVVRKTTAALNSFVASS